MTNPHVNGRLMLTKLQFLLMVNATIYGVLWHIWIHHEIGDNHPVSLVELVRPNPDVDKTPSTPNMAHFTRSEHGRVRHPLWQIC